MAPLVSVIMGTLNGASRVEAAIDSILSQTLSDLEVIVCDDGSTDGTSDVLQRIAGRDPRVVALHHERTRGLSAALNTCLARARGDFIARMDDDDLAHPERFRRQVEFLKSEPRYQLVGTSRYLFDDGGIWGLDTQSGPRELADLAKGATFVHPSVMLGRTALDTVGGYNEDADVGRAEDLDLWFRLYEAGFRGYNLSEPLLFYSESLSSYGKRKLRSRLQEFKLRRKWHKRLRLRWTLGVYALMPVVSGLTPRQLSMALRRRMYRLPRDFKPSSQPPVSAE